MEIVGGNQKFDKLAENQHTVRLNQGETAIGERGRGLWVETRLRKDVDFVEA